jgi:hypothetical protein
LSETGATYIASRAQVHTGTYTLVFCFFLLFFKTSIKKRWQIANTGVFFLYIPAFAFPDCPGLPSSLASVRRIFSACHRTWQTDRKRGGNAIRLLRPIPYLRTKHRWMP